MTADNKEDARLSGWVRLWIVLTGLSWLAGGVDLALSTEPLQWPFPLGDATPQTTRQLLWFVGPILMAAAWCTSRWIWRGFHPPPNEAAANQMGTKEIVRRALRLLEKPGFTALMLAWIGGSIFLMTHTAATSFWLELVLMVSLAFKVGVLIDIWGGDQPLDGEC